MTTLGPDGIEYPTIVIEGFNALSRRDYNRFEELLENGLDINSRGPYYNSFILPFITNYNITTVRFLLENGIYPNILDINDLTPLDYVYRLPSMSVLTDEQLQRLNTIRIMLRDYGGYTSRELRTMSNNISRQISNQNSSPNSSPNSIPSEPDYELMRNQAATQIQRRIRGRQLRQNRNLTRRNTGYQSLNPTRRERLRRFTDHNRMLQVDDPLSGYLHDVYFPPKISSKTKSPSKSKRKVAKRTKKKRNRKNRY